MQLTQTVVQKLEKRLGKPQRCRHQLGVERPHPTYGLVPVLWRRTHDKAVHRVVGKGVIME